MVWSPRIEWTICGLNAPFQCKSEKRRAETYWPASLAFVQSGVRHEIFRVVMVSIDGDIGGSV